MPCLGIMAYLLLQELSSFGFFWPQWPWMMEQLLNLSSEHFLRDNCSDIWLEGKLQNCDRKLRIRGYGQLKHKIQNLWRVYTWSIGRISIILWDSKGGLISERFSLWLKSPKKVPNHSWEHYPPKQKIIFILWKLEPK